MPFLIDDLTVEDFTSSGWESVVAECDPKRCDVFSSRFGELARAGSASGDTKSTNLFALLSEITSLWIRDSWASGEDPLCREWEAGGQPSANLDDLIPALKYLSDILPNIGDPELCARVADVLWLRGRGRDRHPHGQAAVLAYLAASIPFQTEEDFGWGYALPRIARALDIAARLKQPGLNGAVVAHIEAALAVVTYPRTSFPVSLMEFLLKRRAGDPHKHAPLAETLAATAEAAREFHRAREYWQCAAQWHQLAKDDTKARTARLRVAETYVDEADAVLQHQPPSHGLAASYLEQSIQAFRKVGGQSKRIAELRERLLVLQPKAVAELSAISHRFDTSELSRIASQAVEGKNLYEALFQMACMAKSPSIASLQEQCAASVLRLHCGTRVLNETGQVIARSSPTWTSRTGDETAIRALMFRNASVHRVFQAIAVMEPARQIVLFEQPVALKNFLELVSDHPFVPQGREMMFARGLLAGMHGDFLVAVHLLVPQIENSLRWLLKSAGVETTSLDDDGIQAERGLNTILEESEFAEPLAKILGPDGQDLVFDLRGLLVERFGDNLRNDTAHGLLNQDRFDQPTAIYLWCLVLRLVCLPFIWGIQEEQARRAAQQNTSGPVTDEALGANDDSSKTGGRRH